MKHNLTILVLILSVSIFGCSSNTAVRHVPTTITKQKMKLVVFLDGTANDEKSYTNVSKLHKLTTLQDNPNISTVYIKGVGTDNKVIGMATGWGIGHDVREAYLYLAENYDKKREDEIYIFGFSRGAYAARILSALIHVAGIPDLEKMDNSKRYQYIKEIYDAYKSKKAIYKRRQDVEKVIGHPPKSIDIQFLGLWDTIEALGIPDYEHNWKIPNPRYADQLCNVKKAAHAVSIDDDRARIFTPILLTENHLVRECEKTINIDDIVEEVWFSGAHLDVGGGYQDTHISGLSLNWMINQIDEYDLVPDNTRVYADYKGKTHDPEAGIWGLIYHRMNRNLKAYAESMKYNSNKLKIHRSVFDRLKVLNPRNFEYNWIDKRQFKNCFDERGWLIYKEDENCFTVVEYN